MPHPNLLWIKEAVAAVETLRAKALALPSQDPSREGGLFVAEKFEAMVAELLEQLELADLVTEDMPWWVDWLRCRDEMKPH